MIGHSYSSMTSRKAKILYPTPGIHTQFHHSLLTTPLTHVHVGYTHTNTIHHTNVLLTIIQRSFPQVMDSQMNSELLDEILNEEMISLSAGESDEDIFGNDGFDSIIDESMNNPPKSNNQG